MESGEAARIALDLFDFLPSSSPNGKLVPLTGFRLGEKLVIEKFELTGIELRLGLKVVSFVEVVFVKDL